MPRITTDYLDKSEYAVLKAMLEHNRSHLSIRRIAFYADLCEKTVKTKVRDLIDKDYVARPKGERKGAVISEKGRQLIESTLRVN